MLAIGVARRLGPNDQRPSSLSDVRRGSCVGLRTSAAFGAKGRELRRGGGPPWCESETLNEHRALTMKTRPLLLMCILLMCMAPLPIAGAAAAQDFTSDRASPYARAPGIHAEDSSRYQLDIVAIESESGTSYWAVEIRCIGGCKHSVEYRDEDVPGPPIAAFQLGDGMPQFITLWCTASAYAVVIYDFSGDSVRKVLATVSRGVPQFVDLPDGSPGVVMYDHFSPPLQVRVLASELWTWDGTKYVLDR